MSEIEKALLEATVVAPSEKDGKITASYRLPVDFPGFRGHFPGNPVCPAVVQSRAALLTLERAENVRYRLEGVSNAKFMNPLGPEQLFTVELTARPDGESFDARLESGGQPVAKLRFRAVIAESGPGESGAGKNDG